MKLIKLSQWAVQNGYSYRGAFGLWQKGLVVGAFKTTSGVIRVRSEEHKDVRPDYTLVYVRVSSSENKPNLETQADRVSQFCSARGWVVDEVVKECASGLNDTRPKLQKILRERIATRIVVEHQDRLTRFGFNYLKTLYPGDLVVINKATTDENDLMLDFVSLVTSFCARLYGKRRSKRNTEKLIKELKNDQVK